MDNRFLMNEVNPKGYAAMIGLEKYLMTTNIVKKISGIN